ncbi:MAG: nicotinate-nucleotide adenylyltransferase [Defluviitaleaceae bacterium]|nr:nicotinate-nucleotide adenylyltransferase [Defluviitaleaceae bacterium]
MKKVGIMGGTFDPIHNGHLIAAQDVMGQLGLDEIIFMPAGTPPLKSAEKTAAARHRHVMCILATWDNPKFSVSTLEIDREGTSYTVDTISQLKAQRPHDELFFIVGADVTGTFHKWRKFDEILRMCKVVATTRPGSDIGKNLAEKYGQAVVALSISDIDISSTRIRTLLASGHSARYLLPQAVHNYIRKEGLYIGPLARIKPTLQANLSAERFAHSLAVLDEAESLGRHYHQDEAAMEKLRLAALLHDCAKNLCEERPFTEINALCEKHGVALDSFFEKSPGLAHGFIGAVLAEVKYGINDADVQSAIACHTFGKPKMTTIDKIIYIADFIEATRPVDEARSHARKLAYEELDAAMIFILQNTIERSAANGKPIYEDSRLTLKYLEDNYGKN